MMPGNGARDPLDDWLDRGIHPLPPPDGTFEAISKRARNRKMGKLAMVASSAAAVVVTTALVVPSLLAAPAATTPLADGSQTASQTTRASSSNSPTPSAPSGKESSATPATPATSDGPAGDATASASATGYPAGGPVPDNFQPTSVTFIGASTGWAIGQAGTPGSCANKDPYICTSLVFTQDNASTWQGVKAPDTAGVSGIRFLNGRDGWAYGPELWSTHDYGQTWQQVPTGSMVVTDLETEGDQAFAVFASCGASSAAPSITFYGNEHCTDFTLETTPAGSDNWTQIATSGIGGSSTTLTMSGSGPTVITRPTIVLQGGTGWLVGPLGQVFTGPLTSGTWTQVSTSPCAGISSPVVGSAMLDLSLATGDLIMACNEQESTTIFSSADGGGTWSQRITTPAFGVANWLTASPAAPDILATTDGIVALNASSGQWHVVASLTGGFSYVGMTTDGQGVAVPADASLHQVWMTYDGGISWAPHSILP
jgi:hypothetical protein